MYHLKEIRHVIEYIYIFFYMKTNNMNEHPIDIFFEIYLDDKKVYTEWKMETPDNWNAEKIKETLVSFVNQWFQIEFVFVALGSLIISTSVSGFVLRHSLHAAIESFLRDFIELCEIDTSIPTILKIEFRVFDNKTSSVQSLISHKDELETSHHCEYSLAQFVSKLNVYQI